METIKALAFRAQGGQRVAMLLGCLVSAGFLHLAFLGCVVRCEGGEGKSPPNARRGRSLEAARQPDTHAFADFRRFWSARGEDGESGHPHGATLLLLFVGCVLCEEESCRMKRTLALIANAFPIWIVLGCVWAWFAPGHWEWFKHWITPGLGVIMLGMGLTLRVGDFMMVFRMPRYVVVGLIAQFTIMPMA
ncbi:MAG: hypothetical protein ACO3SO_06515, partial [Luteolibacter sp.]